MAAEASPTDFAARLPAPDWETWRTFVRYEFLIPRRSRLGLALLVVCCVAGLIAGLGPALGPSLAAIRAWRLGVLLVGFASLPLMAMAARLDALSLAADTVESRPHSALTRLLARYLGNLLFVFLAYAVVIVAAWAVQLLMGGGLPDGAGPRFSLGAPVHAFTAGLPALLYVSTLAYCVSVLVPNLLSVAIVALYWLLILFGREYLSRIFDFALTQNALPYALLSIGLMALTLQVTRWRVRVGALLSRPLVAAAIVFLLGGLLCARGLVLSRHDPPFHAKPLAISMAAQNIRNDFVPGFWLPDRDGRRTGLHDLGPGPLLIVFWSPTSPESVDALAQVQRLHRQYADRGLRVVAICLADDWSVSPRLARERGYEFAMVTDTGCHFADKLENSSPLAEAYEVSSLPGIFVADPYRRLVDKRFGVVGDTWLQVEGKLKELLPAPAAGATPGG
jgi:hypothetical protein